MIKISRRALVGGIGGAALAGGNIAGAAAQMSGMSGSMSSGSSQTGVTDSYKQSLFFVIGDGPMATDFKLAQAKFDGAPDIKVGVPTDLAIKHIGVGGLKHLIVVHPDGNEAAAVFSKEVEGGQTVEMTGLIFPSTGKWMAMCHTPDTSPATGHSRMMAPFDVLK